MLNFDGGRVVVTRNNQPPSKLNMRAQFRQWKGGEHVKHAQAGVFNVFKGMGRVREAANT